MPDLHLLMICLMRCGLVTSSQKSQLTIKQGRYVCISQNEMHVLALCRLCSSVEVP